LVNRLCGVEWADVFTLREFLKKFVIFSGQPELGFLGF
jgi:hypothetical protein